MGIKRGDPYIWATWLPALLTGEHDCRWAAWFKAHHRDYDKEPSDFDSVAWKLEHAALMERTLESLERKGYSVSIEGQNYFQLRGRSSGIILAGKPDLIAVKGDIGVILDAKTGKPKEAHSAQVMIYMWAVPAALARYRSLSEYYFFSHFVGQNSQFFGIDHLKRGRKR